MQAGLADSGERGRGRRDVNPTSCNFLPRNFPLIHGAGACNLRCGGPVPKFSLIPFQVHPLIPFSETFCLPAKRDPHAMVKYHRIAGNLEFADS